MFRARSFTEGLNIPVIAEINYDSTSGLFEAQTCFHHDEMRESPMPGYMPFPNETVTLTSFIAPYKSIDGEAE